MGLRDRGHQRVADKEAAEAQEAWDAGRMAIGSRGGRDAGDVLPSRKGLVVTVTDEVVALLQELDNFPKPWGEAWWESADYRALMERKNQLVRRLLDEGGALA